MDTIKFIEQCYNQMHQRLAITLQGLSEEQLLWRPAVHANCIAEIAFHAIYARDRLFSSSVGLRPPLWESQRWYERFGYPKEFPSTGWIPILRGLRLPPPRVEDLLAYMEAIHQDTLDKLHTLSPSDLDRAADPNHPERLVAFYLRHSITHTNNHHGQIDYIRGLMQPGWDLPPGTGIIQP